MLSVANKAKPFKNLSPNRRIQITAWFWKDNLTYGKKVILLKIKSFKENKTFFSSNYLFPLFVCVYTYKL